MIQENQDEFQYIPQSSWLSTSSSVNFEAKKEQKETSTSKTKFSQITN